MRSNTLSWRRVRALCVKETRQIVRDPSSWLIAVVIPCCCCLFSATD